MIEKMDTQKIIELEEKHEAEIAEATKPIAAKIKENLKVEIVNCKVITAKKIKFDVTVGIGEQSKPLEFTLYRDETN